MKKIIFDNGEGGVSIATPSSRALNLKTIDEIALAASGGAEYEIVDDSAVPTDRTFRDAWNLETPKKIGVDMGKAKEIAHVKRRVDRAELMAPLDIEATIPDKTVAAEAARVAIRASDSVTQSRIDNAANETVLLAIMSE